MRMPPLLMHFLTPTFLRYLLVGGLGFLLDYGGMEIFYHLGFDIHAARALSMTAAIACTYLFHRYYTFTDSRPPDRTSRQLAAFGAVQLGAAALNYGIFCIVLWLQPRLLPTPLPGLWQDLFNLFAVAAGVGAGLVFNYLLLRTLVFAAAGTAGNAAAPPAPLTVAQKNRRFRQMAVWGVFGFTMVLTATLRTLTVLDFPNLEFPLGPPNPDVWLRLTQVRQWIAGGLTGGHFFDHTVRNTNAPFGGVTTPWTRPVDMLLSLFYFLTPRSLDMNLRLLLAASWMAPSLCLIAVSLMAQTARRYFNHTHVLVSAVMLTVFNAYLGDYFSPGDADHHGFLSTLWCGVLFLVTRRELAASAAFGAGALLGVMIWVSPEALLLAAPVYALLGLEALLEPKKMARLAVLVAGTAVMLSAALLVERPFASITVPVYDSLSIVHVALLWIAAVAAAALVALFRRNITLRDRIFCAAFMGALAATGMGLLYPKFFHGPLVDADPFIFTGFLPNVTEAQPLFKSPWPDIVRQLTEPLLAAVLIAVCFRRGWRQMRAEKRRFFLLLAALFLYTLALTVVQIRWEYYLQPIAIIICAALLPGISMAARGRLRKPPPRQWRPYLWLAALFAAMNLSVQLVPVTDRSASALCQNQIRYVLQTQQLQPLLGDKNITLFVPENAGGDALFFTPYGIIASNYHREGAGLKDMNAIAHAKTAPEAYFVLSKRKAAALLYCPGSYAKNSWLHEIADESKYPRWLTPVKGLKFFTFEGDSPKPILFKMIEFPSDRVLRMK